MVTATEKKQELNVQLFVTENQQISIFVKGLDAENAIVTIYNIQGEILDTFKVYSALNTVSKPLVNGFYLVKLQMGDRELVKKVVLNLY